MALTAPAPLLEDETARRRRMWLVKAAEILQRDHGLALDQLPADLIELGLSSGDTPAEFVAGALASSLR
jgi:hypothetical protein